jgi:hypothetical protein
VLLALLLCPAAAEAAWPQLVGASYTQLVQTLGQPSLDQEYRLPWTGDPFRWALWRGLGLYVVARGDRVAEFVVWQPEAPGDEGPARFGVIQSPEGIKLGDPAERVLERLGTPFTTRPFSVGIDEPVYAATRWVYWLSERVVMVADDRVIGLGALDSLARNGIAAETLRQVLPGERFGSVALGTPSSTHLKHRPDPDLDLGPREGGPGVLWFRPPDAVAYFFDKAMRISAVLVRSFQEKPGDVRSDSRWFRTPQGVRLGQPVKAVRETLGEPRRIEQVQAEFRLLSGRRATVALQRLVYDGLLVEIHDGVVWGLGVTSRDPRPAS